MSSARTTPNNSSLVGRFHEVGRGSHYVKPRTVAATQDKSSVRVRPARQVATTQPATRRQAKSEVLQRTVKSAPKVAVNRHRTAKSVHPKVMIAIASLVFMLGLGVALMGFRTNEAVKAQGTISTVGPQSDDARR